MIRDLMPAMEGAEGAEMKVPRPDGRVRHQVVFTAGYISRGRRRWIALRLT